MNNLSPEPGDDRMQNQPVDKPEDDGRNKEWQDRARVNLEQTPEGVHTNVERDFEPENEGGEAGKKDKETPPPY